MLSSRSGRYSLTRGSAQLHHHHLTSLARSPSPLSPPLPARVVVARLHRHKDIFSTCKPSKRRTHPFRLGSITDPARSIKNRLPAQTSHQPYQPPLVVKSCPVTESILETTKQSHCALLGRYLHLQSPYPWTRATHNGKTPCTYPERHRKHDSD